jgi:alpha-1,3-glucosyltransferase
VHRASRTRQPDNGSSAHFIAPEWVALDASRGIETPGSKLFMRLTVLLWDLLIYIPALLMFVKTWQGTRSQRTQEQAFLILLLQPALLLVDHGHFQYNSSMLGESALASTQIQPNRDDRIDASRGQLSQSRP